MAATATAELAPMEREIVAVLRAADTLTTSAIHAALTGEGRHTSKVAVRTRLALLARLGVVARRVPGHAGGASPQPTVWALVE